MSFPFCYCLCFFSLLPMLIVAQNNRNISLGESLIAGDESPWVSPSGDFAFGFQQVGTGDFLLAIWFNNIRDKTVTWSANRDALAQRGSKLQLNKDGKLVLSTPNGTEMWSRAPSGVDHAAMLNTGNFVLASKNSTLLWQSFHEPTDTILPTQTMEKGIALIAPFSSTNYSSGRFKLIMQDDGNFVFYTLNWPQQSLGYGPYGATATVNSGYQVVFGQSGSIYAAANNGTQVAMVLSDPVDPGQDLYQRAILDFDGVFRKYVHPSPRTNSTDSQMEWKIQTASPIDICSQMNADKGGGACGFNSYCQIGDDQRPTCRCPQNFSLFDETDKLGGCKPDFTPQSCSDGTQDSNQFQLEEMPSVNFPESDYEVFLGMSENSCRSSCLSDCLCAAVVFNGEQCWKKRFPLSNGWNDPRNGGKTLIKVRIGNSTTNLEPDQHNLPIQTSCEEHQTLIITESVLLGSSAFLNILLLVLAVFTAKFCTFRRNFRAQEHQDIAGTHMRNFSYRELERATNGFKEVVGQGAFATVYKGLLDAEERNVIAVKKLNELVKENQREFESEVRAIAKTGHRNLVQLIGFCNEQQHKLLVYEYMPNGSLADILFQDQKPNWFRRIKFALDTARGLNYLHEECSIQIIHCDIKPQNVLLDDSFTARISDFGLAKLLKKDQTHTITCIRGTKGYVAPEWFKSVPITTKVDVYSYGILLLELVCCRRSFQAEMEDESQMVLADWAYDCYKEGRIDKLVKSDYEAMADIENVKKFVMIALWCIQEDPSRRPSMNEVVQMIREALKESLPQGLASYISSLNVHPDNSLSSSTEDFSNTD